MHRAAGVMPCNSGLAHTSAVSDVPLENRGDLANRIGLFSPDKVILRVFEAGILEVVGLSPFVSFSASLLNGGSRIQNLTSG